MAGIERNKRLVADTNIHTIHDEGHSAALANSWALTGADVVEPGYLEVKLTMVTDINDD